MVRKRALHVASSLLNEQRRPWFFFAEQIEIFQVKYWLATFKERNADLKLLDDCRKRKKKTAWSNCGGRSRPPPSIDRRSMVEILSLSGCRSLSKSVAFGFFKFVGSEAFYCARSFFFCLSTKPCWTNFSQGRLRPCGNELSMAWRINRPSAEIQIVRRLSLWLTRFSCILVMDRKKLWFSWPFSKRKMKCTSTFGSRAPAALIFQSPWSYRAQCRIFRHEKFADPTRYG